MVEELESDLRIKIAETSWVEHEDFTVEVYFDISYLALRKYLHGSNGLTYTESKWYNNKEVPVTPNDFDPEQMKKYMDTFLEQYVNILSTLKEILEDDNFLKNRR